MTESFMIIDAGGIGRETADVVEPINRSAPEPQWQPFGVVEGSLKERNLDRLDRRGIASLETLNEVIARDERPRYVVDIGSPRVRPTPADSLDAAGFSAATPPHPDSAIGSAHWGDGTVALAGARVSGNIRRGRRVHPILNVAVRHETVLQDGMSVNSASSVSGDFLFKVGALIGVGAVVLNGLTVGFDAPVGGSAHVVKEASPGVVMMDVLAVPVMLRAPEVGVS